MYTLAFLLNTILGILTHAIRQEKGKQTSKNIHTGKEGEKKYLYDSSLHLARFESFLVNYKLS